jgi:hypothetical protein
MLETIQSRKSSIMSFMRNISQLLEETWYKYHWPSVSNLQVFINNEDWKQTKKTVEQEKGSQFQQLYYNIVRKVLLFFKLLATRRMNIGNKTERKTQPPYCYLNETYRILRSFIHSTVTDNSSVPYLHGHYLTNI